MKYWKALKKSLMTKGKKNNKNSVFTQLILGSPVYLFLTDSFELDFDPH